MINPNGVVITPRYGRTGSAQIDAIKAEAKEKGKTAYVVGLMFSQDGSRVLLQEKTHPAWQAGKHNGPGGKVEEGETFLEAMIREFREETGYHTENWESTVLLVGDDFIVEFFRSYDDGVVDLFRRATERYRKKQTAGDLVVEEALALLSSEGPLQDAFLIPNLCWIIPLSNDHTGVKFPVVVRDGQSQDKWLCN